MYKKSMLYKDWLLIWLDNKRKFVKDSTYATYSLSVMNHLIPTLGNYPLAMLSEELIQEKIFSWLEEGGCLGGGLSQKTVKELIMLVKASLRAAAKAKQCEAMSLEFSYPHCQPQERIKVFSSKASHKLYTYLLHHLEPHNLGLLIALYTGMRIGEVCALQWQDIDLERGELYVHKTLQRIFGKDGEGQLYSRVVISDPKSHSSRRCIPLKRSLLDIMRRQNVHQGSAYVITGTEQYTEPSNYRAYYYKLLHKLKLPQVNFHGLRHTFATRLIEIGVDYKTVSELLGHSNVNITLNLYVHPNMEHKHKVLEKLNL